MSGDPKATHYSAPRERGLVAVERGNVHERIRSVDPRSLPQLDPEALASCAGQVDGLLGPQPTVTMPASPEAACRRFHMGGDPIEPLPGMPTRAEIAADPEAAHRKLDVRALAQAIAEAVGVELNRVRRVDIFPRPDGSTWITALVAAPHEVEQ